MTIGLGHYLAVGAILFTLGILGIFLNRKNIIIILMSIELILLAVNINLVAFSTFLGDIVGQVFALLVLTVAAAEAAVVTIGSLQAGTKENVIPEEAVIKLNVRSFDEGVRQRVLAAIERIVNAEAAASGAPRPPEITPLDRYPLVVNDPAGSKRVADAFRRHFSADRVRETGPAPASEDFGSFGAEWHAPSVFWFVGGTDPDRYAKAKQAGRLNEIPTNHNPRFAPVIHPTLQTGVEALIVAARAWLAP